ncbi:MAG: phage minor head protein [Pseudomonadota bacterium]|nr:phage minor head protein [Pseudomonadota bacterium]
MKPEVDAARLAFEEAIAAFAQRQRLVGTARYDDIRSEEHYRGFAVAGAMKADLLADLREAVRQAVEDGVGLEAFRTQFFQVVKKHGWHGWTGEGTEAGEAWRTRVIYTTNVRKSWSTGRYAQLTDPEFVAEYPYWQWVHSGLAREPRTQHLAWGAQGLTLHHSDPFWRTYYPPRIPPDYGCTCRVKAVRRPAEGAQTQPPAGWNQDTDAGAGAPPDFVAESIRYFVDAKTQKLPLPEGQALREAVAAYQAARQARAAAAPAVVAQFAAHAADTRGRTVQMVVAPVDNGPALKEKLHAAGQNHAPDLSGYAITLDNNGVQHAINTHGTPGIEAKRGQIAVGIDDFQSLSSILASPDAVSMDEDKSRSGRDVLLFDKEVDGIGYRVAMEIRPGRRTLAFNSMRKKRGGWN